MIDCRREVARIYRLGVVGKMKVEDVRQLAAVLRILGSMIIDGELEARIAALEALQGSTE